jgi:predicted RNase H-like nuclease
MSVFVGADGYRDQWLVVVIDDASLRDVFVAASAAEVLAAVSAAEAFAFDIPLGLPDTGLRVADTLARRLLARRGSSVFATFPRSILEPSTYQAALAATRELGLPGISRQSYGLRTKILELDEVARGDDRVIEAHPELSFYALASDKPCTYPKKSWNGLAERLALLTQAKLPLDEVFPSAGAAPPDDVVDAAAAAWTARRYARGEAVPLPEEPGERLGTIWR